MKAKLLLTTIAAVVLVGCGESQQSAPPPEVDPAEPVSEAAQPESPLVKLEAQNISIHRAILEGDIQAVKQHLAAGTDVNAKNTSGKTPIHFSATKETAELLIDRGADVNTKDNYGRTPLLFGAVGGYTEVAELLISKGADVNAKDDWGGTPLIYAARGGYKEIAELLIASGADVNATDVDGQTPLDFSIRYDDTKNTALLRKHGGKTGEELKAEGK